MIPDFWHDRVSSDALRYVLYHIPRLQTELEYMERGKAASFHTRPFFEYFEQFIKDEDMPRGKSRKAQETNGSSQRPTGKPEWINVRLDDTDVPAIERYGDNAADVLGEVIELSLAGADIGIKLADDGASRMAYLIAPNTVDGASLCGLSAFADNPYDALVCLLYKFTVKLDRQFEVSAKAEKPRYR